MLPFFTSTHAHVSLLLTVAEEAACEDAIYYLTKALKKQRIGLDDYLRETRSLARKQFFQKALAKKIVSEMGGALPIA